MAARSGGKYANHCAILPSKGFFGRTFFHSADGWFAQLLKFLNNGQEFDFLSQSLFLNCPEKESGQKLFL